MSTKTINIAHLTYDMRIGGTEQVIRNIALGMKDVSGFNHSIVCLENPIGPFGEMLIEENIKIEAFDRKIGFDFSLLKKIRSYIIDNNIHILHCHQYTPWCYGALAAAFTQTKVIFTEHGRFYPDSASKKRRFINPILALFTNKVTAISSATKQALVDFEYLNFNNIEVVYNGIQPLVAEANEVHNIRESLGLSPNNILLGTVSRFDPIKNHTMLLKAFRRVINRLPDCKLIIVGDGEERKNIEALVEKLEISSHVILTGYIRNPVNYIAAMDIFLLPSFSEGTSMTLLEAMSLEKACIVTKVGGNPEIIFSEINGLVTENNNIEEFSDAIIALIESKKYCSEMKVAAREIFIQRFSTSEMVKNYRNIYESV